MPFVRTDQQLCCMQSVGQRDHLTDITPHSAHASCKLAILQVNDHRQPAFRDDHYQSGTIHSLLRQALRPVALQQHRQDDFDLHDGNEAPYCLESRLKFPVPLGEIRSLHFGERKLSSSLIPQWMPERYGDFESTTMPAYAGCRPIEVPPASLRHF